MKTQKEILKAVKARLERGWCKESVARDAYGNPTCSWDPKAVSWCLIGACVVETRGNEDLDVFDSLLRVLWDRFEHKSYLGLDYFNDHSELEDVLSVVDEAILRAP